MYKVLAIRNNYFNFSHEANQQKVGMPHKLYLGYSW
jgi:hypothetical protein